MDAWVEYRATGCGRNPGLACITTFFTRGEGTPAPFDPPRKFVGAGPYKFVRNPMYIGGFVVLLGFGFHEQSPAILLFAPLWLLLAHLLVIFYEEPHLRETFGPPYDAYCRSVRRWLPGCNAEVVGVNAVNNSESAVQSTASVRLSGLR